MYQFFVESSQINIEEKRAFITGSDVNHIRNVLRMKIGEEINLSNGIDGKEYRCAITDISEDMVGCELRFIKEDGAELPVKVTLYQGLPKADKFELIIQKCVELGVYRIVPVEMKRCVMKLDAKKSASKVARWQAIAEAAAKQSKRGIIPEISMPISFSKALEESKDCDVSIVPYEMYDEAISDEVENAGAYRDGLDIDQSKKTGMDLTRQILSSLKPGQQIAVFIGPEGGFDDKEIEKAIASGSRPITLGKRILRTETAGLTVMSWIMLYTDM